MKCKIIMPPPLLPRLYEVPSIHCTSSEKALLLCIVFFCIDIYKADLLTPPQPPPMPPSYVSMKCQASTVPLQKRPYYYVLCSIVLISIKQIY